MADRGSPDATELGSRRSDRRVHLRPQGGSVRSEQIDTRGRAKLIYPANCTAQSLSRYEILKYFASSQFIRSNARSSGPIALISLQSSRAHPSELPPNRARLRRAG
jgi:hypothetical protein